MEKDSLEGFEDIVRHKNKNKVNHVLISLSVILGLTNPLSWFCKQNSVIASSVVVTKKVSTR